jgi:hypothetical protein
MCQATACRRVVTPNEWCPTQAADSPELTCPFSERLAPDKPRSRARKTVRQTGPAPKASGVVASRKRFPISTLKAPRGQPLLFGRGPYSRPED